MERPSLLPMPVIVGPTAGGKSALAVEVALRIGGAGLAGAGRGEVISADSIQVYRGLDIGSGKATTEEMRGVPHHLLDIRDPLERFSVEEWLRLAEGKIADIRARGRVPVVVGGTHLYVKALLEGIFEGPSGDPELRASIVAMDPERRYEEFRRVDPLGAARIHRNDERRIVRALEVYRLTGEPISSLQRQWDSSSIRPDTLLVGLDWPSELINRRINARVKQMVERGLIDEVRGLWSNGRLGPTAREALGYKQIAGALDAGGSDEALAEAVERTKIETRRFAKNQRTWLRRLKTTPGSVWIDAGSSPPEKWADLVLNAMRSFTPE